MRFSIVIDDIFVTSELNIDLTSSKPVPPEQTTSINEFECTITDFILLFSAARC
jgi:hypothetical protein